MRYIIFRCFRNRNASLCFISFISSFFFGILLKLDFESNRALLWFLLFVASFVLTGVFYIKQDPSGYEGKVFVKKLSKWKGIYKGKFLNIIYRDFLYNLDIDLEKIISNFSEIDNSSYYKEIKRWKNFLINYPEYLGDEANIEIAKLLYKIAGNIDDNFNPITSFYPINKIDEIRRIIGDGISAVCKKVKYVLERLDADIEIDVQSVIQAQKEDNHEKDILNETIKILERTNEFKGVVKELKKYLTQDIHISVKLNLILENVILYYKKYQNSNDYRFNSEFRRMMLEVENYLNCYSKKEMEDTILTDIAGVKAVSNFCKLV